MNSICTDIEIVFDLLSTFIIIYKSKYREANS